MRVTIFEILHETGLNLLTTYTKDPRVAQGSISVSSSKQNELLRAFMVTKSGIATAWRLHRSFYLRPSKIGADGLQRENKSHRQN